MAKRNVKKIVVYFILIFIVIGIMLFPTCRTIVIKAQYPDLVEIAMALKGFIHETKGKFPTSEQDLIDKGFLKIVEAPFGTRYVVRVDYYFESRTWGDVPLERFKIYYGATVDNLRLEGDVLYRKDTNVPVLLIDGPCRDKFKKIYALQSQPSYEEFSVELYKMMLEYQKPKVEQEGTISKPEQTELEEPN
jgi:hypothetical protein